MIDLNQPISVRVNDRDRPSVPAVPRATFDVGVRTKAAVDFSNRQIAILFVALAAITSIPVLLYPWPPLSDYMNHLSRMHIIATIGSDPDLSRFYEIDWQVIPNLMMDLVVPMLDRVMNIYLAGQIYTIASFVLILSGTLALNRRLYGHWSVLPLIAFPLLYNNVFLVGTMNYVFGIGLALWALAAWISLRERSILLRLGVSALFVLALFFCHLFAVGLYGLGLLAFELYWLGAYCASSPRPLAGGASQREVDSAADRILRGRAAISAGAAAADDESDLEFARHLSVGVLRQARRPHVRHRGLLHISRLLCLPASSPSPPVGACGTARSNSIASAGCCWGSAASPIWRCRASSSRPTWPTSGCRSRSPS